ncbi:hypothetical protein L3Q82_002712 [Scortum barcoo]|uniref:Uncharacterized protein n=1 Tax=Scortum barcoo TaxID=214431 RepID=A0ACB8VU04_9TELE|nr:hypothetical protein L3Q82_002712 [Scortum barcoo]
MLLSPQAERNWEDLCSVLEDVLEDQSHRQLFALELGSGTGQHVIRFAQKMPSCNLAAIRHQRGISGKVYAINGTITPSCNEDLDAELRKINPEWGLPDIDVLRQLAYESGMRMERIVSHILQIQRASTESRE